MHLCIQALANYLEEFLQPALFIDHCPNGLQIEGKKEIKKLAVAVSSDLETIKEAIHKEADALIVHHGLFWNKDSYPLLGTKKEKIKLLLENEVSLLAYHLPLDAHRDVGNNFVAAKEMGWKKLEPFESIGVKGEFKEMSARAFQALLEKYYDHKAVSTLSGKKKVKSAALISGGAHREIYKAAAAGVDCFITGSFDEPIWHIAKEEKLHFFALGHSATERIGPKSLANHLRNRFKSEVFFIDIFNPF